MINDRPGSPDLQNTVDDIPGLERLGQLSEIGSAVTFPASGDADYISDSVPAVDGRYRFKDCVNKF